MEQKDYSSNSHRSKEQAAEPKKTPETEEKKIEPVELTGSVVRRKKTLGTRFKETFIGGEDATGVWQYVMNDVLVPAFKDTLTTAVTEAIERAVFGDVRSRRGTSREPSRSNGGHVQYNRIATPIQRANGVREDPRPQLSRDSRARHEFDRFEFQHRVDAEEVIDKLYGTLEQYDVVKLSDFYTMIGQTPEYVDEKWGWEDLVGTEVVRVKGAYILKLPAPRSLN